MAEGVRFCSTTDGIRLGYLSIGSGPPLVIVPGWWMSPEADRRRLIGRDFWSDLPAGRRTITYDLRGIGVSSGEIASLSVDSLVDDLCALADHLQLRSFGLWSFHDGAAAAVSFAARFPDRVERLVLYNPWAYVPGSIARGHITTWETIIAADWGLASRCFAELLYPKGPLEAQEASTKAIRETQTPAVAAEYLRYTNSYDVRPELGRIRTPTLVISREGPGKTPLVPMQTVALVAGGIPGARLIVYDAAPAVCPYFGHRVYTGAVREFLAGDAREVPRHPTLTPREIEVLQLIARGRTNAEIARCLVISQNTADRHVSNILAKTGSSNRAEAVLYAARHALVD